MTKEQQAWVVNATYAELLQHWRFAPTGDSLTLGNNGKIFKGILFQKAEEEGRDPLSPTQTSSEQCEKRAGC